MSNLDELRENLENLDYEGYPIFENFLELDIVLDIFSQYLEREILLAIINEYRSHDYAYEDREHISRRLGEIRNHLASLTTNNSKDK